LWRNYGDFWGEDAKREINASPIPVGEKAFTINYPEIYMNNKFFKLMGYEYTEGSSTIKLAIQDYEDGAKLLAEEVSLSDEIVELINKRIGHNTSR